MSEIPSVEVPLTKEELEEQAVWEAGQHQRDLDAVAELRRSAYIIESDPLAFKYTETQLLEDRQAWLDKKLEIQTRFPEPPAPKAKKAAAK